MKHTCEPLTLRTLFKRSTDCEACQWSLRNPRQYFVAPERDDKGPINVLGFVGVLLMVGALITFVATHQYGTIPTIACIVGFVLMFAARLAEKRS